MPRDTQEDSRIISKPNYIHSDRISQINSTIYDIRGSKLSYSESYRTSQIVEKAEGFISDSQKERKAFKEKGDPL